MALESNPPCFGLDCHPHPNPDPNPNPDPARQNEDNLREALRFSSALLSELRTSLLTPQKYFELYMQAFNQLSLLQARH